MSPTLYLVLRIVHIASMAVWFGGDLLATSEARRTLEEGGDPKLLQARMKRALTLSQLSGLATAASGVAMIFAHGGFAKVKPTIHAGLGLTVVALAVTFIWLLPAWGKVSDLIDDGYEKFAEDAKKAARKITPAFGTLHLLRAIVLVLMIWR